MEIKRNTDVELENAVRTVQSKHYPRQDSRRIVAQGLASQGAGKTDLLAGLRALIQETDVLNESLKIERGQNDVAYQKLDRATQIVNTVGALLLALGDEEQRKAIFKPILETLKDDEIEIPEDSSKRNLFLMRRLVASLAAYIQEGMKQV